MCLWSLWSSEESFSENPQNLNGKVWSTHWQNKMLFCILQVLHRACRIKRKYVSFLPFACSPNLVTSSRSLRLAIFSSAATIGFHSYYCLCVVSHKHDITHQLEDIMVSLQAQKHTHCTHLHNICFARQEHTLCARQLSFNESLRIVVSSGWPTCYGRHLHHRSHQFWLFFELLRNCNHLSSIWFFFFSNDLTLTVL